MEFLLLKAGKCFSMPFADVSCAPTDASHNYVFQLRKQATYHRTCLVWTCSLIIRIRCTRSLRSSSVLSNHMNNNYSSKRFSRTFFFPYKDTSFTHSMAGAGWIDHRLAVVLGRCNLVGHIHCLWSCSNFLGLNSE